MTDQMSDADFLRATLDRMGSPEQWCKNAYVLGAESMTPTLPTSSAALLQSQTDMFRSPMVTSMCLEGALLTQHYSNVEMESLGDAALFRETQLIRLQRELANTFAEQYPELAQFSKTPWPVRHFNDHEAMTYEGVRSVVEKTIARLEE